MISTHAPAFVLKLCKEEEGEEEERKWPPLLFALFSLPFLQPAAETATGGGGGGGALSCPLNQDHNLHRDLSSSFLSAVERPPPPPSAGLTPGTASVREEKIFLLLLFPRSPASTSSSSSTTSTSLRMLPGSAPSATISRTSTLPSPQPLESLVVVVVRGVSGRGKRRNSKELVFFPS